MSAPARPIGEEDLVAYADGRLEPARADAVAAWLRDRPAEQARVDGWRAQAELLKATLDPVAAEPVPPALSAAVRREAPRRGAAWRMPAAAAVVGIAVGLGAGWRLWSDETVPARGGADIAELGLSAYNVFVREVRHAVEVDVSEEDHLIAWLSKRLDSPLKAPDLSADGLTLLGGRVVPENGRPAALLMYENPAGERFTLLIARSARPTTTAFRYAEDEGHGAFYWMDGTIAYVLAGPDDRERLLRISRAVYDQLS